MKSLFLIFFLLLATPSWATFAIVTSTLENGDSSGVTTSALNTTGANLIVIATSYINNPVFSDSKGNTWTPLTTYGNSGAAKARIYYCSNPTVGSGHTFTFTGASSYAAISVYALSGAKTSSPFDQENGAGSASTSGTSLATGSITPSENNEIIISGLEIDTSAASDYVVDSGMTQIGYIPNVVSIGASAAYKVQTTAASINPTWSGSAAGFSVAVASFKAEPAAAIPAGVRMNGVAANGITIK